MPLFLMRLQIHLLLFTLSEHVRSKIIAQAIVGRIANPTYIFTLLPQRDESQEMDKRNRADKLDDKRHAHQIPHH